MEAKGCTTNLIASEHLNSYLPTDFRDDKEYANSGRQQLLLEAQALFRSVHQDNSQWFSPQQLDIDMMWFSVFCQG